MKSYYVLLDRRRAGGRMAKGGAQLRLHLFILRFNAQKNQHERLSLTIKCKNLFSFMFSCSQVHKSKHYVFTLATRQSSSQPSSLGSDILPMIHMQLSMLLQAQNFTFDSIFGSDCRKCLILFGFHLFLKVL